VPYGLEGEYLLTLEAELEDYPTVKAASITILIIVEESRVPCVVASLKALPHLGKPPVMSRSKDGSII
jgi:hypothetical protein